MFFVEKQTFAPKKFTYSIITFTKIDELTAAAPLKGNSNNYYSLHFPFQVCIPWTLTLTGCKGS